MNQLKTLAHQVKTFGTYLRTDEVATESTKPCKVDVYRMDTVTHAYIEHDRQGNPRAVTFCYGMN